MTDSVRAHLWRGLALFVLAFLVRVVPWLAGHHDPGRLLQSPDCFEYDRAAKNLVAHGTLSLSETAPPVPDTFRTPGYPLFLALVYRLGGGPGAAVFVQLLLAAFAVALFDGCARRFVGERAAGLASIAWALDIGGIASSLILLSETLCMVLVAGAYAVLAPVLGEEGEGSAGRRGLAAGVLLGLAALVRPAVLYLPLVLVLPAAFVRPPRRALALGAALAVGVALPVSAWIARNVLVVGTAEFSSLEGQNYLFYRASGVMARVRGVPLDTAWGDLKRESERLLAERGWPRARYGELCRGMAVAILREHPKDYAVVLAKGAAKAWLGLSIYDVLKLFGLEYKGLGLFEHGLSGVPGRLSQLSGGELAAVGLDLVHRALSLALGALGLVMLVSRRAWRTLALVVPPLVYVTLTCGTVISYYRFRLPAAPFWCLLMGVALEALVRRFREKDPGQPRVAGV